MREWLWILNVYILSSAYLRRIWLVQRHSEGDTSSHASPLGISSRGLDTMYWSLPVPLIRNIPSSHRYPVCCLGWLEQRLWKAKWMSTRHLKYGNSWDSKSRFSLRGYLENSRVISCTKHHYGRLALIGMFWKPFSTDHFPGFRKAIGPLCIVLLKLVSHQVETGGLRGEAVDNSYRLSLLNAVVVLVRVPHFFSLWRALGVPQGKPAEPPLQLILIIPLYSCEAPQGKERKMSFWDLVMTSTA